jgi:hypothetical protein
LASVPDVLAWSPNGRSEVSVGRVVVLVLRQINRHRDHLCLARGKITENVRVCRDCDAFFARPKPVKKLV